MLLKAFSVCAAVLFLYLTVQGIRSGALYNRSNAPDEDQHGYIHRDKTPLSFWSMVVFYVGMAVMFLWVVIAA